MGRGSYKASDWAKLKDSRKISTSSNVEQIFSGNTVQDKYNPKFINMRESCDSEDSPLSTPIIIGFDVTGSMGYLAAEIAKNSLNKTITQLYEKQPVTNPHVMCAAVTEPIADDGLQVTQFEADIRIIEQLLDLKVGFGGNWYSYDSLVWYFAAKHTSIDSFNKRNKKGFLFFIGDEICGGTKGETLKATEIKNVFNDVSEELPLRKVLEMAQEKYEVFHIVTGKRYDLAKSFTTWYDFLPGRVAMLNGDDVEYLSEVITSIMQLANGADMQTVVSQWGGKASNIVCNAVKDINLNIKERKSFFKGLFT